MSMWPREGGTYFVGVTRPREVKPIFCETTGRAKQNGCYFRVRSAGGNESHIFEIARQNLVLGIMELRETYLTLFSGLRDKKFIFVGL